MPVGDDAAMAEAILATLDAPGDRASRIARGMAFSVDRSVDRYLALLNATGLPTLASRQPESRRRDCTLNRSVQ